MHSHLAKLAQFNNFLVQRYLKIYSKEKETKTYLINFKERRSRLYQLVEDTKNKAKVQTKDSSGCILHKAIYGECFPNVRDGLMIDFLHSFVENPFTTGVPWIYDIGLIDIFTTEKPIVHNTQTSNKSNLG